ncbi:IclR family transcriptional regulator [Paenibacillus sp. J5C_2022]|uniref:IclR family transcriptional regulator n=1 Tax=Paenibacillus sp. J5C2022 TaxID=2977129 RepID=UPI0021D11DC6|nr:IclR family transcriptional regulator [Paenibacillus sp. J5C2022]MCU6711602.1 IclR family transcriptional regulator [Paenibacillus sp. J5C2022]
MTQQAPKVKSADRVLDILELFTGEQESYNLTEIAKSLNMPPSSTYLILQNMLNRGYLETDRSKKQFRIGYKLFAIRSGYMRNTSLTGEYYQIAQKILDEINETVSLSIRTGNQLYYIGEKVSTHSLRFNHSLGTSLPLHATAAGKVLLADLSEEELRDIYPDEQLEKVTDKTISTFSDLLKELEKVRKQEFGYNMGETVDGVHCIAGAIRDSDGKAVASLSISIPVVRINGEMWGKVHDWIRQGCMELSSKVYQQH